MSSRRPLAAPVVALPSTPRAVRRRPRLAVLVVAVLAAWLLFVGVHAAPPVRPAAVPAKAVATITARNMEAHLRFLTSDLLEGRVVGHRGNEIAQIYLASVLTRLGLEGVNVSNDGPYYQPFEMVGQVRGPGNKIVVRQGPPGQETQKTYEIGADLSPVSISASKAVSGPVVFAGYGISSLKLGHDDYQGINVTGKIVLVQEGTGNLRAVDVTPTVKVLTAQSHGAIGLMIVSAAMATIDGNRTWPETVSPKVNRFVLPERADNVEIPVANISVKLAEQLLGEGRSVQALQKALDEKQAGTSFALPSEQVTLAINLVRRRVTVRNLLAMMRGTDPKLKNEVVVIGAHFDANGIDDKGLIYTGADDNGSGTAAVLAVAEAFARAAEAGFRPRRAVLFALWDAEEKGRGGSIYYVGHRLPSWGTVVVNVNVDHAGRNEENIDQSDPRFKGFPLMTSQQNANVLHLLGYSYCPDVAKVVMEENAAIGLDVREDYDQHVSNLVQRSDHWSFLSQGIPAVFLHTGLHPDYHMPTDTIEKINFPKLEKVARLAFRTVWRLSTQDARPQPPRTKSSTND
jgi:hypothetical protein